MNNCEDIEKLKAKSKNNILWLLLMFAIIGGGVCEYRRFQAPLDDLVVVYSPGVVDVKEDKLVATDKVVQEKPNLVEEKEVKKEIALIKEKKVNFMKFKKRAMAVMVIALCVALFEHLLQLFCCRFIGAL